jgi:hypothetical protein
VLTAAGGFGGTTFSNTTIAINSSEQFDVSYSSTGVVLTVVAIGSPSNSSNHSSQPASQMAIADPKNAVAKSMPIASSNNLRHALGLGVTKHASTAIAGSSRVTLANVASTISQRAWEHVAATPSWDHIKAVSTQTPRMTNLNGSGSNAVRPVGVSNGIEHAVPVRAPLTGWGAVNNVRRMPVPMHMLPTTLPVVR